MPSNVSLVIRAIARAATLPSLSITSVVGIAFGEIWPRNRSSAAPDGSYTLGYGILNSCWNRFAGAGSRSRVFSPTNCTDGPSSSAAFAKSGASWRHGGHHEPQTFRTTTLPRWSDSVHFLPSSVSPLSAGAGLRSALAKTDTLLLPLTKPD